MKEIISFGDYFEWYTILSDDEKRFRIRKTKEDEGTTETDETKEEVLWLMTWKDFTPSKEELLNLQDVDILEEWLTAVRLHIKGSESTEPR